MKDIISRENSVSTAYHVDIIFTGCHGRPRFDIQREHLEFFVEQGFTSPAIANILEVSLQTIERRLNEFSIRLRSSYSDISSEDLDGVVESILCNFPETGYKRMTGFLKTRGIIMSHKKQT